MEMGRIHRRLGNHEERKKIWKSRHQFVGMGVACSSSGGVRRSLSSGCRVKGEKRKTVKKARGGWTPPLLENERSER